MPLPQLAYRIYERRLQRTIPGDLVPRHVGVILDGNRRWARQSGTSTELGHQAGANKISDFLGWCHEMGIEVVTLWMLSTDNLQRDAAELEPLIGIIEQTVRELAGSGRWQVRAVGSLDLLPTSTAAVLRHAQEVTSKVEGMSVNVAVGYGGRHEIADAVRSLLREALDSQADLGELANTLGVEDITRHLYTKGQPDPDLVIRTSGEQRMGGFLMWQSQYTEFYFCEAYWPDFRRVDFLRAIRSYAARERRHGR